MRFEFAVKATGGINVIPEFEVSRLCLLEGSNGIGKTLAVHLLELATGKQPYLVAQSAWDSLRTGISELFIRISGLRDANVLEIKFTPSTWPVDPAKVPMGLGHAWYNGQPIDFRTIQSILHVTRIGGDENIVSQFQNFIAADAVVVEHEYKRLDASIGQLSKVYIKLLRDIETVSPTTLDQLKAGQRHADEQLKSAIQVYEQQNAIVQAIDQLTRKQAALQQLQEQGPDNESRLTEIEMELGNLGSDIKQLEMRHNQHLPKALREETLLKEIERLRNLQTNQTQLLHETATKLNDLLVKLQISSVNNIVMAQQQARVEYDKLVHDRELLVAPPDLKALIRELHARLETVRGSSLDNQAVANIGQRSVLVRELRDGLVKREKELAKKEQKTFLAVIDSNIQTLDDRLRRLVRATKLQSELAQKQEALAETEVALNAKIVELDTNRDIEYQQIASELQQLRQRELKLIEQQAILRYTKTMLEEQGTVDALAAEISSLRNKLPSFPETYDKEKDRLSICRNRLLEAQEEQTQASNALADFERKREDIIMLLNQSSDYTWLRAALADQLPTINDDSNIALEQLARLEQAVRRLERVLTTLRNSTGQLQLTLKELAQNRAQDTFDSYDPPIIEHYEKRFGKLLEDPNIQQILFDKGKFKQLDLQQRIIIWVNADGETCRRPLEAFSSGERAFAYVLGSILQQRQVTSLNHLLVLDEFGAFIEAGRIERLELFLYDEVLQADSANAVIIILPLRKQLPTGFDSQMDVSDIRTRMLNEHGYIWNEEDVSV